MMYTAYNTVKTFNNAAATNFAEATSSCAYFSTNSILTIMGIIAMSIICILALSISIISIISIISVIIISVLSLLVLIVPFYNYIAYKPSQAA